MIGCMPLRYEMYIREHFNTVMSFALAIVVRRREDPGDSIRYGAPRKVSE